MHFTAGGRQIFAAEEQGQAPARPAAPGEPSHPPLSAPSRGTSSMEDTGPGRGGFGVQRPGQDGEAQGTQPFREQ